MDCVLVPFTVTISRDSCVGFNLNLFATSREIKFRPEPVSRYAHRVCPPMLMGIMAGRDFSYIMAGRAFLKPISFRFLVILGAVVYMYFVSSKPLL